MYRFFAVLSLGYPEFSCINKIIALLKKNAVNYLDNLLMVCIYGPNNFYLEFSQIYSRVVCYILHYLGTPLLKKNNIEKIGHVSDQYPGHLLDLLQILGMII